MSKQSYSSVVEPIAKPGENIKLEPESTASPDFVEVKTILPLPFDSTNLLEATVNPDSESAKMEMTEMEMTGKKLAQLYVKPVNDFELRVYQLQGEVLFDTKSEVQAIRKATRDNLTQIYVWEDDTNPYLSAYNHTNYQIARANVAWFGWRYHVKEIEEAKRYVSVPVQDTM